METFQLQDGWFLRQAGAQEWLDTTVPGGVHISLLKAGLIPDPFEGDNELAVQWVAESDWEYRHVFQLPPGFLAQERIYLVFDGLDTLAEIHLNGRRVGDAANMLHAHRWEIKDALQEGENELHVLFRSAVKYCAEQQSALKLIFANDALPGAPHLRKAPYQFGWDWGPKLPNIGIWRAARLEGFDQARFEDVHLRQEKSGEGFSLLAAVKAQAWQPTPLRAELLVTSPAGEKTQKSVEIQEGEGALALEIPHPQLWWPNGLGDQPLYEVEVRLMSGDSRLDERRFQVGLRTIELRQEPDEWGYSFTFVVNDVPIFAKGANWIPSDSFPAQITRNHLEHLIRSAALANQNMLRVWGGGYYEDEAFYDLCDQYGILIWQDFIFSCATYPLHQAEYLENLRMEVSAVVRRLRHRTCLALWCGNNEVEAGWVGWGWDKPQNRELKAADQRFFYKTLREWILAEDRDHSYWPSSPSSHLPHQVPDSEGTGDRHLWEVWHALKPFNFYCEQYPRFASEFGLQSLPSLKTIETYAAPEDMNLTSYVMEFHQRSPVGNEKILHYLADQFRLPADFQKLVYLSQLIQGEAMRVGIEHWRRNRARCSGALYWQLNDCWPVASWSSIDYFGRWKALHYASRRFFAPLLLSTNTGLEPFGLSVTNDTPHPQPLRVHWSLETLGGEALLAGEVQLQAAPLATTTIELPDEVQGLGREKARQVVFVSELWQGDQRIALRCDVFTRDKHLMLSDPGITSRIEVEGNHLVVALQTQSLARFVELELVGADTMFGDNYFDLPAGREVKVDARLPEGWDLEKTQSSLQVQSLFDSF